MLIELPKVTQPVNDKPGSHPSITLSTAPHSVLGFGSKIVEYIIIFLLMLFSFGSARFEDAFFLWSWLHFNCNEINFKICSNRDKLIDLTLILFSNVTFQCYPLLSEFCCKEGISNHLKNCRPRVGLCPSDLGATENQSFLQLVSTGSFFQLYQKSGRNALLLLGLRLGTIGQLQNPVVTFSLFRI